MEIADLLIDVGSVSSQSKILLDKILLLSSNAVREEDVARLLVHIIMTASQPKSISKDDIQLLIQEQLPELTEQIHPWNIEILLSSFLIRNPKLDLSIIVKLLDTPEFEIRDYQGVSIISAAFNLLSKNNLTGFPVPTLLEKWTNPKSQFTIIVAAVRFIPELLIQSKAVTRFIFSPEELALKQGPQTLLRSVWNIADLILCLHSLFSTSIAPDVLAFLEASSLLSPELLLLGLAQIPIEDLTGLSDIVLKLTQIFIAGHPFSSFVVPKLWETSPNILISGMVRIYSTDVYSLSRILDISQELKALPRILGAKPNAFVIDLAALASRRDFLNLDKWLQDQIAIEGTEFLKSCLQFLHEKVVASIQRKDKDVKPCIPLSPEVIGTLTRILTSHQSMMSSDEVELLSKLTTAGQQINKNGTQEDQQQSQHQTQQFYMKEVEEESNTLFEKLYKSELSVQEILAVIQKSQSNSQPKETELAKCMIQNLFDEYKYYGQYPEKELIITAQLFGALIQNNVLIGNLMAIGLRGVLEALKNGPDTGLFRFGLTALLQYQSRFSEWQQYVVLLLQLDHLKTAHGEVYALLEKVQQTNQQNEITAAQPDLFTSINFTDGCAIGTIETPDDQVQDKILFIINNVSSENVEQKILDMQNVIDAHTFMWFSKYLVEKRVCLEPNFHQLYIDIVTGMKMRELESSVLNETIKTIKTLMNSDRILTLQSDRVILKNLAGWLGGLTLAKNKPIKHANIGFKELLLEGYDHNRLSVAIPFVCKVLEQINKSKIFKPPNPWLIGIMKVLAEMYHFAELKLNLKFEIEVLCKAIKMDIKDVNPTSFLRERPVKGTTAAKLSILTTENSGGDNLIANMIPSIIFSSSLQQISSNIGMRKLVITAITKSIEEILLPVAERSITIAGIATKELITKDFAIESDEGKMRQSAHRMAQSLAGSLASVTCREPLRIGMIQNLRAALLQQGYTEQTLPDQAVFILVSDNLDLACSIIEKTSSEKAIEEIDKNLILAFEARRTHRDQSNQPFYDMAVFTNSKYPSTLPQSLRLKIGGVSTEQLRVYDDFVRLNRADIQERASRLIKQESKPEGIPIQSEELYPYTLSVTVDKLDQLLNQLDRFIGVAISDKKYPADSIDVQLSIKSMRVLAVQSLNRDDATLLIAQKCVGLMFSNKLAEYRVVYSIALEKVLELSSKSAKEVNSWFVYSIEEKRYNVEVYSILLQNNVLVASELDIHLARLIDIGKESSLIFVVELFEKVIISETPSFLMSDFFITIDMLKRIAQNRQVPECVTKFIDKMALFAKVTLATNDPLDLTNQFTLLYEEWIRIFSHSASNEMIQSAFIQELLNQGILLNDEISATFFKISAEIIISKYEVAMSIQGITTSASYAAIDSFAQFITLLIKLTPNVMQGNNSCVNLMAKFLTVFMLVMVDKHETDTANFNQKPFFRLMSSLLNKLHDQEESLGLITLDLLMEISDTLHSIQPLFLPAFGFSWLQLMSHRYFMPKLLLANDQVGWPVFHELIMDLLSFLAPFIQSAEFTDSVRFLYRGTLRVFLIILHDFPEFLCSYHLSFMDVLPLNAIQLRNIILSAFPPGLKLPDPFIPNFKVDQTSEEEQSPIILTKVETHLHFKTEVDTFLAIRNPSFLTTLVPQLVISNKDNPQLGYNVEAINALVIYSGIHSLSTYKDVTQPMTHKSMTQLVNKTASMDIFTHLLAEFDNEGRYILLSAIANQLRYPNTHTTFFGNCLFSLFLDSSAIVVKEQITRVLLERLIVNRPHPYGLLVTFIELIRNTKYEFWEHTSFIRCAPEIERLFASVSKSINASFQ